MSQTTSPQCPKNGLTGTLPECHTGCTYDRCVLAQRQAKCEKCGATSPDRCYCNELPKADLHTEAHFANHVVFQDLGICGCGDPDGALDRMQDVLNLAPFYEGHDTPEGANWQRVNELFNGDGVGAEFFVNILNKADLMEHGGSSMGGWITPKGKRFLEALDAIDHEQILECGLACYVDGVLDYTHDGRSDA